MADSLFEKEHELFFPTYKRLQLDIVRGEGCYLFDRSGKRYLDLFGGLAVNALGYGHPKILDAVTSQAKNYIHLSNFFVQEPQVRLAEMIMTTTGLRKIFFTSSGTEAVEGALKLARKWGQNKGKTMLFGLSHSFHGRTMGSLSLTERPKYRAGYEPFLPNIGHIKFNDAAELRSKCSESTLGIVLESIQGEGGVNVVSEEFVKTLKELKNRFGFLVIADEIQSGIGRTGKFFAYEHFGIEPDIVAIAKAIGGGLPLGAFLGTETVADAFTYGVHGTTFGGNPVACAAGIAVMEEVTAGGLMKQAGAIGDRLKAAFEQMKKEFPRLIREIRGYGCMLGIELSEEGQPVVEELQKRGFLVNCTSATVLRLLPPYILTDEQIDVFVEELRSVLQSRK